MFAVDTATLAKIASLTSKYAKETAKAATKGKSKAGAKASSSSSSSDAAEISVADAGVAAGVSADDENADVSECMSLEQVRIESLPHTLPSNSFALYLDLLHPCIFSF